MGDPYGWGMYVGTLLGPTGPWGGLGGPKSGFFWLLGVRGVPGPVLGLPYGPARGGPYLVSSYGSPRGAIGTRGTYTAP